MNRDGRKRGPNQILLDMRVAQIAPQEVVEAETIHQLRSKDYQPPSCAYRRVLCDHHRFALHGNKVYLFACRQQPTNRFLDKE